MLCLSQQFMPLFCGRQPHIRSLFLHHFGVFLSKWRRHLHSATQQNQLLIIIDKKIIKIIF
jgi:hypothetical protein